MNFKQTRLKEVYINNLEFFSDKRGAVVETFVKKKFNKFQIEFVQDIYSISSKNVLRGMHGDNKTWKLITLILGKAYIIIANNDKDSDQYKKWIYFNISDKKIKQILIPPKFALGYLTLSNKLILNYKQTTYYKNYKQFTIKYNDPSFKFKWPNKKFILSDRDK